MAPIRDADDEPDPAVSGALPTHVDGPAGAARREATPPGAGTPSLSAFDPPSKRFEMRGELGRGGMGRVEDAFDRALDRPVAIKHILSSTPLDLARFEREARITARLEHPGIVPVHDAGRAADGTPYYVMRQIDGRPLDELVAGRTLAERLAHVPDVLAVCDAVAYAHSRGVVHRDIKPSNILVGRFGETLLIDWGLARELGEHDDAAGAPLSEPSRDAQLTTAGVVAGTPGFMSPEQARGEQVDARSDVFALGATLFHVLAGRPPYASRSPTEMIEAVRTDRPPDWTRIPRGVPADLLAIVHKAMATDPAARYSDAAAMASDVRRFVTGQVVAAHDYGVLEQLRRFARRHRGALAVGGVALVLLAVIGALSIRRIVDERDSADAARAVAEQRRRDTADLRDGELVDHASEVASRDPLAAIALLRELDPASKRWPQVYAAASAAFYRGIPSGFDLGPGAISSIAISPDNTHALVEVADGGFWIIDLVARTKNHIVDGFRGHCLYVHGGAQLACGTDGDYRLIDVATGATSPLVVQPGSELEATDGDARLWTMAGGDLFEADLAHPTASPAPPIAHHVANVYYSPSAKRMVALARRGIVVRGATASETWTVPHGGTAPFEVSSGTRVVWRIDGHDEIWDLAAEPKRVARVATKADDMGFAIGLIANHIYTVELDGVHGHDPDGMTWLASPRGEIATGETVLLVARPDGSILLRDRNGPAMLGPRALQLSRLAVGRDHRFIVAGTVDGTLAWWDLDTFRPKTIKLSDNEVPFQLGHYLWTKRGGGALARYDFDNKAVESRDLDIYIGGAVDATERYVAVLDPLAASVFDFATGKRLLAPTKLDASAFGTLGLIAVSGPEVSRYELPAMTPTHLATLPEPGLQVYQRGDYILATTDRYACRLTSAPTAKPDCLALPSRSLSSVSIEPSGLAWLVIDGKLARWELGGTGWIDVPFDQRLSGLASMGDETIGYSTGSLTLLREPMKSITIPHMTELSAANGIAVFNDEDSQLSIADVAAGTTFSIPLRTHVGGAITDGRRLFTAATEDPGAIDMVTLGVPHDPVALRAWLDRVTNARRTHNGIVSFP